MWRAEEHSPGWILRYEEALLQGLALTLPEGARLINIGAGAGTSTAALVRGTMHLQDVTIWSLDIDPEAHARERAVLKAQGLAHLSRVRQVGEASASYGRAWAGPVNLVFVDGAHAYTGVFADLEAWAPHIAPGGLLVCHDYGDPRQLEVTTAIDDWRAMTGYAWLEVARAFYTTAWLAPGGDMRWTQGRI